MSKLKTILVVTGGYFPGIKYGGTVTSKQNFAEVFGDVFDIKVVTTNHDYNIKTPYTGITQGWNIYEKSKVLYLADNEFNYTTYSKIVKEEQPILIYASGTITSFFNYNKDFIQVAKKNNIPILITPDGDICDNAIKIKKWKKVLAIFLVKVFHAYNNVWFQATLLNEKENLIKYLKIDEKKIFLLPNLPCMLKNRGKHKKEKDSLRLVYSSRIQTIKNLKCAIQAVNLVDLKITFDIYGPCENEQYWDECKQLIAKSPTNVSIRYCGDLSPKQARYIAKDYDCFILPTMSENYGYSIEEAIAIGCPVLLSKGTTPWDDIDAVAGFTAPYDRPELFARKIKILAEMNQEDYDILCENVRLYSIKKFKLNELKKRYLEMFRSCTGLDI